MAEAQRPTGPSVGLLILPVAAVTLVLALAVAAWWVIGDQSTPAALAADPNFLVRPPAIDAAAERVVGIVAAALAVTAAVILVRATGTGRLDPRWWAVLAPLMLVAVGCGYAARILTAGVIGANIGAGLTLIIGGPVALLLLAVAALAARRIVLTRTPRGRR